MTEVSGLCGYRLAKAWMVATLAFGTIAFGGQEIRWVPVRTGELGSPAGIVGDPVEAEFNVNRGCWEIILPAGGAEVDLDLQALGWGDAFGSPTLGAIQATVLPAGYDNGSGGILNPKGWPESPADGAYQPQNTCEFGGGGEPCSPPFDPNCTQQGGGICVSSPRYVMPGCAGHFSAIATPTLDYAWAVAAVKNCAVDDGEVKSFGGLILEVPANAAGTYRIGFDQDPNNSFMTAGDGTPIAGVVFTPACITLPCQSDGDCGDGLSCTTDLCNQQTFACENDIALGSCLIARVCYSDGQEDPADSCRFCDTDLSQTDWSNQIEGAACGDPSAVECDGADACDGAGSCLTNIAPSGTACGDPTDVECDRADTCDGLGICSTNIASPGTACGDPTDVECNAADTCDGAGSCLTNIAASGTACGDPTDTDCNLADTCDAAGTCLTNELAPGSPCTDDGNDCTRDLCSAGNCTHRNWAVGTPCGDATDVPCDGADTCDGIGSCLSNGLPDGTPCPNEDFCDGAEMCLNAVCQSADPPCDPEDDLCDEQNEECDLLGDHDGDMLLTLSDFLYWPDCATGPVGGPYAGGCEIFDFEQNLFVDLRDSARFLIAFTMP
ncbi:MAG: hypothetical protein IH987_00385 [Planctomycetes bacterium]|nr:hypothetical protein [Planctomycetota bacterium]